VPPASRSLTSVVQPSRVCSLRCSCCWFDDRVAVVYDGYPKVLFMLSFVVGFTFIQRLLSLGACSLAHNSPRSDRCTSEINPRRAQSCLSAFHSHRSHSPSAGPIISTYSHASCGCRIYQPLAPASPASLCLIPGWFSQRAVAAAIAHARDEQGLR
jgi:hypothetical protein